MEWRESCRCGGAKALNTFACYMYMQSEGGCGQLPTSPEECGGVLFLHDSKYGDGKWWGCSGYKNGCRFTANYVDHKSCSATAAKKTAGLKKSDTNAAKRKKPQVSNSARVTRSTASKATKSDVVDLT